MIKNIFFVADFFVEDLIGGGELNNEEAIHLLKQKNYHIQKIKSYELTPEIIKNLNGFFIIANFIGLSEACKESLKNKNYIIYEHDHKFLKTRNPTSFKYYLSNEKSIINKEFYKNAIAILCQSKIHCEVLWKNLGVSNIINCSGNLWSTDQIQIIKKYLNVEKKIDCGILGSTNKIKNTNDAISFCEENNLNYKIIPFTDYESYISQLAECKKLVFFPKVLETLSRTSIEAKILGCKLITNNYLGVASEEWIKQSPQDILNHIENNNKVIIEKIIQCIEQQDYKKYFYSVEKLPKISIITSIFNGEKYIENFLSSIVQQTIFSECELILINANSSQNEEEFIKSYLKKFNNIKYIKLDDDPGIYGCWNIGIKASSGEFICNTNLDDLRTIDNLEILRKHLYFNKEIDLVYGDSIETKELPILNKNYDSNFSEHSIGEFSQENMIKCLPGPLPLWKKEIHYKYGFFNESYKSAGDWEMWLRAVSGGSKFKKVDTISGYYYNNPSGKSTSKEFNNKKFLEEKEIFFKYKNIFGDNYNKFLSWFSRDV